MKRMKGEYEVARKPKAGTVQNTAPTYGGAPGSAKRIEFTFINVTPNAGDVQWLLDNEEAAASFVFEWIADIPDRYKLSVSRDVQSGRFNATLACSDPDDPNYALILSFRGSDAASALYGLAYSDQIKLEGQWRRAGSEPASRFG